MRRKNPQKNKAFVPIPPELARLQEGMTTDFLQPPLLPGGPDTSYFTVRPWPSAETPARGLGHLPPFDEEFARTNAAESAGVAWQMAPYQRHPLWARQDMINAKKKLEWELLLHSPQSWRHDLNQFNSAHVSQPPQTRYELPEIPDY